MKSSELNKINKEKDLGLSTSNGLKPSKHCSKVVKTVNRLISYIGRTFMFKSEKVVLTLFNAIMHLQLEYCFEFWSPYYRKS